jgi:3-methylcrotonyl-CoA carboxylase alpha subunit
VFSDGAAFQLSLSRPVDGAGAGPLLDGVVRTPMPGRIVSVAVAVGDEVSAGQTLLTLEAMKMEHGLVSATAARVTEVCVSVGEQVSEGVIAARLEPIG